MRMQQIKTFKYFFHMSNSACPDSVSWFDRQGWQPHEFQLEAWHRYAEGFSGLLNAPTGSGKTYALLMPILELTEASNNPGIRAIWITPIRALAKEIELAANRAIEALGKNWKVEQRTGDTSTAERAKQKKNPPEILITTPESLHLLLATKQGSKTFDQLEAIVIDEWHELLGGKRGVQVELALSRLRHHRPQLRVWGISATIGNLEEAQEVLLGVHPTVQSCIVKANIHKQLEVHTLLPDDIHSFPWAGHYGIKMLESVLPVIDKAESTLIFTNTRAQCEIWYQQLLEAKPDLAGIMAMHHSSMSKDIRSWVENALHTGDLKVVVCTSSLDLGVDFRPVESVVQIGSPKGVARFLQRAGRSGHRPGAVSSIYFLPTHALELIEAAALKDAVAEGIMESRSPVVRAFDVLIQYLVTIAVGDGLDPRRIYQEIITCHAYASVSPEEWSELVQFTVSGGSLSQYEEHQRIVKGSDGIYRIANKHFALRHRLSIGTIVSDNDFIVQYVGGGRIGQIEEWFVSHLLPGDVFWFAGRALEFVRIKDNIVQVRKSNSKKGKVPAWMGGRMPLSSMLSDKIRHNLNVFLEQKDHLVPELAKLRPLMDIQLSRSIIPSDKQLLIEYFESREGHHLIIYPFEGRFVHEGLGSLIAYRLSQIKPITFSIAMNDYGFELLSDQPIPIQEGLEKRIFTTDGLSQDIVQSINSGELAKRSFRDIAAIAGLLFKGFPGREKRERHMQSSSSLLFKVFQDYDPSNPLFLQAFEEARYQQLEEDRLRSCLNRIDKQSIQLIYPGKFTPLSFPIIVDRLRAKMSSEKLEDRVLKMKLAITKN
jgi:ATP-dependent Lhr-like helicase